MQKKKKGTALVLGGGGSRGAYQIGVWQALRELGVNIDMAFGASVGAVNAVMVAQDDLELTAELWKEMETDKIFDMPGDAEPKDYLKEIIFHQGAGSSGLKELLLKYVDEDAVRSSRVITGITATELKGLKGHRLLVNDIPKGLLVDYIIASSSAFPAVHSYEINGVEYIDGGYCDVLPVSMANAMGAEEVIAVNLHGFGQTDKSAMDECPRFRHIEASWDLGYQFTFDKANTKRIMRLGYLDTMHSYKVLDGKYFAFSKGTMDSKTIKEADCCAKIFGLDPEIIYTRDIFMDRITNAVRNPGNDAQKIIKRYAGRHAQSILDIKEGLDEIHEFLKDAKLEEELKTMTADKVITLMIANSLKDSPDLNLLNTRTARALFHDQINAAKFINKFRL